MSVRGFELVERREHPGVDIAIPVRADRRSAGYDFSTPEKLFIAPKGSCLVWSDIKAYMQDDEVLKLYIRSSLGIKKGLRLKNGTGVIDASYYNNSSNEGNIGICLHNPTDEYVVINAGDRIAQGVFEKFLVADNDITLNDTRVGGIGSSGE